MTAAEWTAILATFVNFLAIVQAFATTDIFSSDFHDRMRSFIHRIIFVDMKGSAAPYELSLTQSEITRFVFVGAMTPIFIFLSKAYKVAVFTTLVVGVVGICIILFTIGGSFSGSVKNVLKEIGDALTAISMTAVVILIFVQIALVICRRKLFREL